MIGFLLYFWLLLFCFSCLLFCPKGPPVHSRLCNESIFPNEVPFFCLRALTETHLGSSQPHYLDSYSVVLCLCFHFQKAVQEGPLLCGGDTEKLQSVPSEEKISAPEESSPGFPEATQRAEGAEGVPAAAGGEAGGGGKEAARGRGEEETGGGEVRRLARSDETEGPLWSVRPRTHPCSKNPQGMLPNLLLETVASCGSNVKFLGCSEESVLYFLFYAQKKYTAKEASSFMLFKLFLAELFKDN